MRQNMMGNAGPVWLILGLAFVAMWLATAFAKMLRSKGRNGHWWRIEIIEEQPAYARVVPQELPPA